MSEIMKSLAESEQGYKATQAAPAGPASGVSRSASRPGVFSLLTAVLLPPVLATAYLGYGVLQDGPSAPELTDTAQSDIAHVNITQEGTAQAGSPQTGFVVQESESLEITPSAEKEAEEKEAEEVTGNAPQAQFAVYPEMENLRPFSSFESIREPQSRVAEVRQAKTDTTADDSAGISSSDSESFELESLDLSELSPELAERVQNALDGTGTSLTGTSRQGSGGYDEGAVFKLTENTNRYSGSLPAMNLQTHMYASSAKRRWVKINDQELQEGEWLGEQVQLLEISPRSVIVRFQGERIEIPALYEWQG